MVKSVERSLQSVSHRSIPGPGTFHSSAFSFTERAPELHEDHVRQQKVMSKNSLSAHAMLDYVFYHNKLSLSLAACLSQTLLLSLAFWTWLQDWSPVIS